MLCEAKGNYGNLYWIIELVEAGNEIFRGIRLSQLFRLEKSTFKEEGDILITLSSLYKSFLKNNYRGFPYKSSAFSLKFIHRQITAKTTFILNLTA